MLSNILDKISFWSLFLVIVLLPVFFLPFTRIPIETAKVFLIVLGLTVSIVFWAAARFSDGKIIMPKSYVPISGALLVLVMLVSSLFSSASQVSFFGLMLEVGTFWFIFSSFLVFLMSALIIKEKKTANMVLSGLVISALVVFVFQILRFIDPATFSLSVLGGKTSNLVGSWNTFGVFLGLMSLMALFAVEFFHLEKKKKTLLTAFVVFTLVMAAVVNFSLVWKLLGIFALLIFVYKISISSIGHGGEHKNAFPGISFAVILVSLLFFMSGQFIGNILPNKIGLFEIEIGPSFNATMQVTKNALKEDPIFGIGPNRFSELWAMYKPEVINLTAFWDTSFNAGSGLLPTFISTTGILGILAWLVFLGVILVAGVKILLENMKHREGSEKVLFFVSSLYLFVAAFFYNAGSVVLVLAFAFTGIFIGLSSREKEHGEVSFAFLNDPRKSFFSILALVLLMLVSAAASFKFMERFSSVYFFQKALFAQNVADGQRAIGRAISLYPNDLYYRTYGNIHLLKINELVTKEGNLTDEDKSTLQASLTETVSGANMAIEFNKNQYVNFQTLGSIQQTLGRFEAPGAYEEAIKAYEKALELNPLNPGLKLGISTSYLGQNKLKEAKEFALQALEFKPNYADAMVVLSRIERESGNNTEAIKYAEGALSLFPNDESLRKYVESLKLGAPITPPSSIAKGSE